MTKKRFAPNGWLGMLDLTFLLCMLFFLTTVISVRRLAVTDDVAQEAAHGPEAAIVLRLRSPPSLGGEVEVLSTGGRAGPGANSVIAWLASTCAASAARVEIACPPDSTHRACKRGVLALRRSAQGCRYQY